MDWFDAANTLSNNHPYTDARGNIDLPGAPPAQIMLRPNPIDHPNFTGGNPAMARAIAGGNDVSPKDQYTSVQPARLAVSDDDRNANRGPARSCT